MLTPFSTKQLSDLELKQLREELNEKPDGTLECSVNIINSVVTDSNIFSTQSNSTVSSRPPKLFMSRLEDHRCVPRIPMDRI